MKVLVDMNLSPSVAEMLGRHGWNAVHWSAAGDPRATDSAIMDWALANGHVVITHDLDFGTLLALTHANGPSVVQIRTQDVLPDHLETVLVPALRQTEADLERGALVTVHEDATRVRVLPIGRAAVEPDDRR